EATASRSRGGTVAGSQRMRGGERPCDGGNRSVVPPALTVSCHREVISLHPVNGRRRTYSTLRPRSPMRTVRSVFTPTACDLSMGSSSYPSTHCPSLRKEGNGLRASTSDGW